MNKLSTVCFLLAMITLAACGQPALPETGNPTSEQTKPAATAVPESTLPPEPTMVQAEIQPTPTNTVPIPDGPLKITILYDNYPFAPQLQTEWGFSALIEFIGQTILFDTGGNGTILMNNIDKLSLDPSRIEKVILSHGHGDHIGGVETLYNTGLQAPVYVLADFANPIRQIVGEQVEVVTVSEPQRIAEGIYTTGQMSKGIPEQSLVIQGPQGLVVITGCAHPGISEIVDQARNMFDQPIDLVMGGFHLRDTDPAGQQVIIARFDQSGVVNVAPSHCTGDMAISDFRAHYQEHCLSLGVGQVIIIE
jgi:7,8-dihydropterin-6-yl-methyl-4-(beta-D-ribofuranosyl)aminobenzene 5'-phosphate synthase